MSEIIGKEDERIKRFMQSLDRLLNGIEKVIKNNKPCLNGNRFLTDKEVAQRLKIERRTLQEYRTNGKIPYYKLGGKILYSEQDIQKLLEQNYYKSFE